MPIKNKNVKKRPILFNAPMVRAILDGRKTMTRRIVKWQGPKGFPHDFDKAFTDNPAGIKRLMVPYHHPDDDYSDGAAWRHYPPHGDPGDRLWVRETHAPQADCWAAWAHEMEGYNAGPKPIIHYRADGGEPFIEKWRPSIHMPRWASRITLEITGVRVERLNDISEADAEAEGVENIVPRIDEDQQKWGWAHWNFRHLWESINGPGGWSLNPWVWVISFERVT